MLLLRLSLITLLSAFFGDSTGTALQQKAARQQKHIAIYFCGSDWCGSCHQFKKHVLSNSVVDSLLNHDYVFYVADFPQRRRLPDSVRTVNELLAEKLNPNGIFPSLIISDENLQLRYAQYGSRTDAAAMTEQLKKHRRQ